MMNVLETGDENTDRMLRSSAIMQELINECFMKDNIFGGNSVCNNFMMKTPK